MEVRVANRDELLQAISAAGPGTTILVAPGVYRGGIAARDLRGTADQPIAIAGERPDQPPIFEGGAAGLHLTQPVHVELRNLVFRNASGNGVNIDDGGSANPPARHVRLVKLRIEDVGPRGNRDGIKFSGVDNFLIQDCAVLRWGDAGSAMDLVGCHQGRIEGCHLEHPDAPQANGIQTKGGSRSVIIHGCRFQNAGGRALNIGGSTGLRYFRPPDVRFEAAEITVEDCTIVGSMAAAAFVGVDGATFQYNTIYHPTRWVFRILQENTAPRFTRCRNVQVRHNLIVFQAQDVRSTVNIGPNTEPETFRFVMNAWCCSDRRDATERLLQLPSPETNGVYGVAPQFAAPQNGNLHQRPSSPLRAYGVRTDEPSPQ